MQSPLLCLPCEILISTLLFAIDDMKRTPTWTTILPACYHLYQLVLSPPQVWREIHCLPPRRYLNGSEWPHGFRRRSTRIYSHRMRRNWSRHLWTACETEGNFATVGSVLCNSAEKLTCLHLDLRRTVSKPRASDSFRRDAPRTPCSPHTTRREGFREPFHR